VRFLGLALGVVILVIGVSAAVKPDLLTVPGFAQTEDLEAAWTAQECVEFNSWPAAPSVAGDFGEFEGKDVGSFLVTGLDSGELSLSILNSYPSHGVQCVLEWVNSGTLEARAETVELSPGAGLTGCSITASALRCDQLTVEFDTDAGECVDPGEPQELTLLTHTEQPSSEGAVLEFTLEIDVVQCEEPFIVETPVVVITPTPVSTVAAAVVTPTSVAEVGGVQALPPTGFGLAGQRRTDWAVSGALLALGSTLVLLSLWAIRRTRPVPIAIDNDDGEGRSAS
jgi:hypothetical protein